MRACCMGLVVLGAIVACAAAIVLGIATITGAPNEIRIIQAQVDPRQAAVGAPITITLKIENVELDAVTIRAVGLDARLLEGATLVSTQPVYRGADPRRYPVVGEWTEYRLNQRLLGGETLTITLTLTAAAPGVYDGDLTVWVQSNILGVDFVRARRAEIAFTVQ